MLRPLRVLGLVALAASGFAVRAATVAEFDQQIANCPAGDVACVDGIVVKAVQQFASGSNTPTPTPTLFNGANGIKGGVYTRSNGDIPCTRYELERKTQSGTLQSIRLQCTEGSGGNGVYKCTAGQAKCILNADFIEAFDDGIEITVGSKSGVFVTGG